MFISPVPPPSQIAALDGHAVGSLSLGQNHSLASAADGTITWIWGTDHHGSLGQGVWVRMPMASPQQLVSLPEGTRARGVVAGWQCSAEWDAGGRLCTWGCGGGASDSLLLGDGGSGGCGV